MKVILLEDVKGKGKKNEIIEVSDGYGKNFLIKNKLGVLYTTGSKKVLDNELSTQKKKEDDLVESLNEVKKNLENANIRFKVKVGKMDKVFGSVSSKQIKDELEKHEIINENIKSEPALRGRRFRAAFFDYLIDLTIL